MIKLFKRRIALLSLALIPLASCQQKGGNILTPTDAHKLLLGKRTGTDSLAFWAYKKLDSVNTLVGIYTNTDHTRIGVYVMNGSDMHSSQTDSLKTVGRLNKTEWVQVNGRTLLFVDYPVSGLAPDKGQAKFNLYDPVTGALFSLDYAYTLKGRSLNGAFDKAELDSLKKFPQELAFLQKEAGMSNLIPAEDKLNRRPSADSALKKWAMLNEGVYDALDDKGNKDIHLNVEEYNSDISPRLEDFNNDTAAFKASTIVAENGSFKAVSQIKGPVFVLNKGTHKSYIIWAPPASDSYINKLKFKGAGTLVMTPVVADTTLDAPVLEVNIIQRTILRRLIVKAQPKVPKAAVKHSAKSIRQGKSRKAAAHHKNAAANRHAKKAKRHRHHN